MKNISHSIIQPALKKSAPKPVRSPRAAVRQPGYFADALTPEEIAQDNLIARIVARKTASR